MKLVTAIVRTTSLEAIVKSLEQAGIQGMTISDVKGPVNRCSCSSPMPFITELIFTCPTPRPMKFPE